MKSKLLRYLLVLLVFLSASQVMWAQVTTVFADDFNRVTLSPGGSPELTYTVTNSGTGSPNVESSVVTSTVPFLKLANPGATGTAGQMFVAGALSAFSSVFNSTLSSNPGLVTWSVNMRHNTNSLLNATNHFATILVASSSNLATANGYAILNKTRAAYQLVKFTGGLSGTVDSLTSGRTLSVLRDYVSVKVTYDPATGIWSIYDRIDGTSPATTWADPSTDPTSAYIKGGTSNDATFTGTSMSYFGYMSQYLASATSNNKYFDNFKVQVDISACNDITSFKFNGLSPAVTGTIDKVLHKVALTVPYGTNLTALVPTIEILGASISPLSGDPKNFTNPVNYTVTSGLAVEQVWEVTVSVAPASVETDILSFNLASPEATGTVNTTNHTVTLTVPYGTPVTALNPTITISDKATIAPLSGVNANFSSPVTYTVTAEDGTTKQAWVVTVVVAAATANDIVSFDFATPATTGTVNATNHTVALTVPYGTVVTALKPTITVSAGASVSPLSDVAADFSSADVLYTVTAADGTSIQIWKVTVTIAPPSTATDIVSFNFASPAATGTIDETAHTVHLSIPFGDVTGLVPEITLSTGASISPASGVSTNFTSPVIYTVTAQDGTTKQEWTVTVTKQANTATDILTFDFTGIPAIGTVSAGTHTVAISVPFGTAVTALEPTITLSEGATVSPLTNTPANFTSPATYTVTAQDGTSIQAWTVTVTIEAATFPNEVGDYRSIATGNWDDIAVWETYNGTTWAAASVKPGATNSVYIQSGHVITLTQQEACKDLATFKQVITAQGTLQLKGFVLELNGRLTSFSALSPITYATPTNLGSAWPLQTDAGTGKIKVVGNSRALTVTGGWGSGTGTANTTIPNIEIALNAGQTVTLGSNIKFANWTLTSGTLDAVTFTVSADVGSTTNLRDFTIESGASFKSSSAANILQRTSSSAMGVFTIKTGGTMILLGATPKIQATTIVMDGTVDYNANGDQTLLAMGTAGSIPEVYAHLLLSTAGVKTLSTNTTANISYNVTGTASMGLGGFTFTNNAGTDVATLAAIMVNGTPVAGFDKNTLSYDLLLDYGTVNAPAVTWTTSSIKASGQVTNAPSLPGTSTILVTAENGFTQISYSLHFTVAATPSKDASLKDLKVGGVTIPGFASGTFEYIYKLPFGTTKAPVVTAVANSAVATLAVLDATSATDMAFVEVTAQDGNTISTYAVIFEIDAYIYKVGFETADLPFVGWTTDNTIISSNYTSVTEIALSNHASYPGNYAFRFIAGKPTLPPSIPGSLKTSKYPNSGTLSFWLYVQKTDALESMLIHKKVNNADSVLIATLTSTQMESNGWKEFSVDINEPDSTAIIFTSVLTMDATTSSGGTRIWMDDLALRGRLNVGIKQLEKNPVVNLYPNPVREQMTIDMAQAKYETLDVYNLMGSKVLSQKINDSNFNLDVSTLSNGMYVIQFTGSNIIYKSRFVKF
jgi:hypothetical protein